MKMRHFASMAFVCCIAAACGGADGVDTGPSATDPASSPEGTTERLSMVAASGKTNTATGVTTWEVGARVNGYHAIGRDADGRQLVDFRATDVASCSKKKATLVPLESKALPAGGRAVSLGCSTEASAQSVDATTQLMWQSLSSDTGPQQREQVAQYSPNESPTCEPKTNLLCCGHVTLWCEDQWPNQNWECETSGWYPCGACWAWTPWCVEP
jgi:hypothetical protein